MTDISRDGSVSRARRRTRPEPAGEPLLVGPDDKDLELGRPHTLTDTDRLGPVRRPRKKILGGAGVTGPVAAHQAPPVTAPGPNEEDRS
ncbi:hypothetical protein ACIBAI_27350 [Streptomyces sp. NPDC051041]|uniref:hypothetical protein n=1 Tax=Streptomyces sp. NPDC051041 TaxID=3365640 RepID=UPI00379FF2D6